MPEGCCSGGAHPCDIGQKPARQQAIDEAVQQAKRAVLSLSCVHLRLGPKQTIDSLREQAVQRANAGINRLADLAEGGAANL